MDKPSNHIVIVAGEDSGDLHAALLVKALREINPDLTFSGLGGPKMRAAGVELYTDFTKMAVVGYWEVLKNYGKFREIFHFILRKIRELQPAAVVLVDYPGFNLRLAKKLQPLPTKVVYYISPQVWAWKTKRVHEIKATVDRMLVLFEFEKKFYARFGVDVDFVGHPLVDTVRTDRSPHEVLREIGLPEDRTTIGLLPGSRIKEIERHLPVMVAAAEQLHRELPVQFVLIKAPSISRALIDETLRGAELEIPVVEDGIYNTIGACDICLVSSGTATLEVAILGKPMVVMYKTSLPTWLLAKIFVKIPHIALANVVGQREVVPELLQYDATPKALAAKVKEFFSDEIRIARMKEELKDVVESLGTSPASRAAAESVLKTLNQPQTH
ncbi:MAG: lipid-A-disaccharide synthase [Candidatus Omnitrophica bacterium]|nr:lipid-A-disaccharide synthase [Candidatus Omnitrophota bacterium]MCB9721254.1 lipid-A-disaccharide synthase [Candidatus Omnitrophota bacterium]